MIYSIAAYAHAQNMDVGTDRFRAEDPPRVFGGLSYGSVRGSTSTKPTDIFTGHVGPARESVRPARLSYHGPRPGPAREAIRSRVPGLARPGP